ncbi:hypothetical protein CASFOL_038928 [Castilleja foliolosa]|uniref:Uncharacterized protein n=2 Tax=Castilleja foliolosa TaxID=1961234 RepID=A0ABD3BIB8_9LAMI
MSSNILLLNKLMLLVIIIYVVALNACCIIAANLQYKEYESDRVIKLPGQQKSLNVSQFLGYIAINEAHGPALFSYGSTERFCGFGCTQSGGSECTHDHLDFMGPLRVDKTGFGLEFNQNSWNKVGFSYTNTSDDYEHIDDSFAGESYAGHYVPQLAELVGNPTTDDYYDSKGIADFAWSHTLLSDEEYKMAIEACNFIFIFWVMDSEIYILYILSILSALLVSPNESIFIPENRNYQILSVYQLNPFNIKRKIIDPSPMLYLRESNQKKLIVQRRLFTMKTRTIWTNKDEEAQAAEEELDLPLKRLRRKYHDGQ